LPENPAKYRPHRPHHRQCSDLQDFRAVDTAIGIDRRWTVTDLHDKYRPRIDRLEMSRFAGLSPPR